MDQDWNTSDGDILRLGKSVHGPRDMLDFGNILFEVRFYSSYLHVLDLCTTRQ